MRRINFTDEDKSRLKQEIYDPKNKPQVQKRMQAVFMRAMGISQEIICKACAISSATYHRYRAIAYEDMSIIVNNIQNL